MSRRSARFGGWVLVGIAAVLLVLMIARPPLTANALCVGGIAFFLVAVSGAFLVLLNGPVTTPPPDGGKTSPSE